MSFTHTPFTLEFDRVITIPFSQGIQCSEGQRAVEGDPAARVQVPQSPSRAQPSIEVET